MKRQRARRYQRIWGRSSWRHGRLLRRRGAYAGGCV